MPSKTLFLSFGTSSRFGMIRSPCNSEKPRQASSGVRAKLQQNSAWTPSIHTKTTRFGWNSTIRMNTALRLNVWPCY